MTPALLSRIAAVVALVGAATPAGASEVDSVTGRQLPLRDSRVALETRLEHALRPAVARALQSPAVCDERALYDALGDELSSPFIGHWIEEDLEEDPALDRRRVPREHSIYRDLGWLENPSVQLEGLSAVVRVDDTRLGLDKLGHFFVEGWRYFEIAYLDGEGIEAALDHRGRAVLADRRHQDGAPAVVGAQRLRALIERANAIANGDAADDSADLGSQAAVDAIFGPR